jgi:hypothetical protein
MEMQLFSESTLASSFERKEGDGSGELEEVDIDRNLLQNLLDSHAFSVGYTGGSVASNLLSQLGVNMPQPPLPAFTQQRK